MKSIANSRPSAAAMSRWPLAGALLLAAFFLFTSIYIAGHRLFWYDEVFTTLTTRLPDWHTIWRALVEDNGDPSPFGFFVVTRFFDKLFGPSEIGIRLPSALAMTAGMWLTYDCARRVTDRLHGLIAMAVLTCSYLPYYGYEGRPYALFFLFAAAALWVWIGNRSAILLAALFFFGVQIHYYLVLCLIPFAAEEAYNWRPWRRPPARIIGAALGTFAGLAVLLPQMTGSLHRDMTGWTLKPSGRDFPAVYTDLFPAGVFLLAMATLWVVLNDRSETVAVRPASAAERTGWFALAIPVAGYVLAKLVTQAFSNRYFIELLPGAAVGFSCLLWRRFPDVRRIPVGILLLLGGYGVATQTLAVRHPEKIEAFETEQERTRAMLAAEEQLWSSGVRYVVYSTSITFLESRYYSTHPERYVVWWRKGAVPPVSRYYPERYWTMDDIKQHVREAVFVDLRPEGLEALQRAGIHTVVHKSGPIFISYPE
jgi:hypothetical protein